MRAFAIKAGTPGYAFLDNKSVTIRKVYTKRDHMFFTEDVVADRVREHNNPGSTPSVYLSWVRGGYMVFRSAEAPRWTIVIKQEHVEVG